MTDVIVQWLGWLLISIAVGWLVATVLTSSKVWPKIAFQVRSPIYWERDQSYKEADMKEDGGNI